jgi:hypothetical protein
MDLEGRMDLENGRKTPLDRRRPTSILGQGLGKRVGLDLLSMTGGRGTALNPPLGIYLSWLGPGPELISGFQR